MNDFQLPVEFMKMGLTAAILLGVFYFLLLFVKNQIVKGTIYFFKAIAYAGLAWVMWSFYKNKGTADIISTFTFIFCCFESVDNFISLISIPIEYFRDIGEQKNRI